MRLIGQGGMGEVWEAERLSDSTRVAVKFVRECADSRQTRRRFQREVRTLKKAQHVSVVEIYDVVEAENGRPALVMELLDGETLAARLERVASLPLSEVANIMLPVISAVGSAHALGIVHRDLKPENLFLCRQRDGELSVKVVDFGIAKLAETVSESVETSLTNTGVIIGTPVYMSPEQMFGEPVDHRADIWAIGMILYRALSGLLPTMSSNLRQIIKIVAAGPRWSLMDAAPDLPRDVTELVDRMLARDKEERPPDLREVQEVLSRYASLEVPRFGAASVEFAIGDSDVVSGDEGVDPLGHSEPTSRPQKRRAAWLGLVAAIAAMTAVAWRIGSSRSDGVPTAVAPRAPPVAMDPPVSSTPTHTSASLATAAVAGPAISASATTSAASASVPAPVPPQPRPQTPIALPSSTPSAATPARSPYDHR